MIDITHIEKHKALLRKEAASCAVLLRKDGRFPLKRPCEIALYGSGARKTLKGGTGSGDVYTLEFNTCEQALENAGFTITTKDWLDAYDEERKRSRTEFVDNIKKTAKERGIPLFFASFGKIEPERNYDIPVKNGGDVCVYVLARKSGEGSDRIADEGDVILSETEICDILWLSANYKKFMLVLNVGGVVDLTPVRKVKNILLLSQLGVVTGDVLADILLGKANPSGKLTTTWANHSFYQTIGEFGDANDNRYKEGVFVGYRYFDTAKVKPIFPFGFGLSYTDYNIKKLKITAEKSKIQTVVEVENIGKYAGKEVVQLYVSAPNGVLNKAYQSLAAFAKTKELQPGEKQFIELSFDMSDIASYNEKSAQFILEKGDYIVRIGNGSRTTNAVCIVELLDDVVTQQLKNCLGTHDFKDKKFRTVIEENLDGIQRITLTPNEFDTHYVRYDEKRKVNALIHSLPNEILAQFCVGAHGEDKQGGVLGNSALHLCGAAGETSNYIYEYTNSKYLIMADGPAGLRISTKYIETETGPVAIMDKLPDDLWDFVDDAEKAEIKKQYDGTPFEQIKEQRTTAIPIGTAIAQSWDAYFAELCGDIVGEEMVLYGANLWLAPAMNIQRNILCGRNFEYYSEDPLVSGKIAAAVVRGVQSQGKCGATIKHFCANNQEYNRFNNNSICSERALREIYLKGFEICVKESAPKAIMTSYNLLNGEHTSERKDLLEDILRCEWGFGGLVMTDWTITGKTYNKSSKHEPMYAHRAIKAGNDLIMPGAREDIEDILNALNNGTLGREDLEICATRIYEAITETK